MRSLNLTNQSRRPIDHNSDQVVVSLESDHPRSESRLENQPLHRIPLRKNQPIDLSQMMSAVQVANQDKI